MKQVLVPSSRNRLILPVYIPYRCPGRPAIELTRVVNVDIKSGEIDVPPESR